MVNKFSFILCFFLLLSFQVSAEIKLNTDLLKIYKKSDSTMSVSMVAVAGWSENGKIAIVYELSDFKGDPAWLIIDTVTDEVLERSSPDMERKGNFYPSLNKVMSKYKITRKQGRRIPLPYKDPSNLPPLEIKYSTESKKEWTFFDVYAVRGNKKKKLTTITTSSENTKPSKIGYVYAVKSPFEDRALIILTLKHTNPINNKEIIIFEYIGCHLTLGLK